MTIMKWIWKGLKEAIALGIFLFFAVITMIVLTMAFDREFLDFIVTLFRS